MAKLPRRTMSMANRASKIAEAAADLDVMEQLTGDAHPGGDVEPDSPVERERRKPGPLDYLWAWAGAIATVLVLVFGIRFAFAIPISGESEDVKGVDPGAFQSDYISEYGYPGVTEPYYRQGQGRSPFPEPETVDPIIIEVECEPGTVHIATGPDADDSICVKGRLATEPETQPEPTPTAAQPRAPRSLPDTGCRC